MALEKVYLEADCLAKVTENSHWGTGLKTYAPRELHDVIEALLDPVGGLRVEKRFLIGKRKTEASTFVNL